MADTNPKHIDLIQCGDDGWAPWSIICKHLLDGTSRIWEPVPSSNPEVVHDWLCPECLEEHSQDNDDANIDNLVPVCIHCARKVRRALDPNFTED